MNQKKFASSWSGGKDSCYAHMLALREGMQPEILLNILNENGKISRSHAIPKEVLKRQANAVGLPLMTTPSSWQDYEKLFIDSLQKLKSTYHIDSVVFGDIDLQAHRDWEEKVCSAVGIKAILPLWKRDRKELVMEMIEAGIETYIVSCNAAMGESFLGRKIDPEVISQLEKIGVDACGENGEYHTLVVNCPLFNEKIGVTFGKSVNHEGYWFIEMS
jgi:diphthine-ammonia ligase